MMLLCSTIMAFGAGPQGRWISKPKTTIFTNRCPLHMWTKIDAEVFASVRFYQAISPHSAPILSEWLPQASQQEKSVGDSVRLIDVMKKVANEPSAAERRLISPVLRGTEKKSFSIKNSQLWRVSGGSNGQVGMSFRQLEEKRRKKTLSFVTQMDEGGRECRQCRKWFDGRAQSKSEYQGVTCYRGEGVSHVGCPHTRGKGES